MVSRHEHIPSPVFDPLFLAMSYAQLGRESEMKASVEQLFEDQPDWSAEKYLSGPGNYSREEDLNVVLDSIEKAGLPLCATEAQLEKYADMKRLERSSHWNRIGSCSERHARRQADAGRPQPLARWASHCKRLANLAKHGLDFLDADLIFRGSYYSCRQSARARTDG